MKHSPQENFHMRGCRDLPKQLPAPPTLMHIPAIDKLIHYVEISLMAKNLFAFLNDEDRLWIHILHLKYGNFNVWDPNKPKKMSWFFQQLRNSADQLKPYLCFKECSPDSTNFLLDPWIFEIPLAFKPTFINMDILVEHLNVADILDENATRQDILENYL